MTALSQEQINLRRWWLWEIASNHLSFNNAPLNEIVLPVVTTDFRCVSTARRIWEYICHVLTCDFAGYNNKFNKVYVAEKIVTVFNELEDSRVFKGMLRENGELILKKPGEHLLRHYYYVILVGI